MCRFSGTGLDHQRYSNTTLPVLPPEEGPSRTHEAAPMRLFGPRLKTCQTLQGTARDPGGSQRSPNPNPVGTGMPHKLNIARPMHSCIYNSLFPSRLAIVRLSRPARLSNETHGTDLRKLRLGRGVSSAKPIHSLTLNDRRVHHLLTSGPCHNAPQLLGISSPYTSFHTVLVLCWHLAHPSS